MNTLIEALVAQGPVVTDGAWGTQLQARGLGQGESPDHWNLTHPERVEEVPRAYRAAGSRIVLTNTFQANRITLESHGLADQVDAINRAGVAISRRAAGPDGFVFGSIGPTGKMVFMGEVSENEISRVFAEQAQALAAGGADAIVIETMSDLVEAKAAVAAAKATGLPVVACAVFDTGKDKDRTMTGATPEEVARQLTEAGADVIGANCGQGPEAYVAICRRYREATELPLWIKPNAGLPEVEGDRIIYRTSPEVFAEYAVQLADAGASFIGGCCGTSPEFIQAVHQRIHS